MFFILVVAWLCVFFFYNHTPEHMATNTFCWGEQLNEEDYLRLVKGGVRPHINGQNYVALGIVWSDPDITTHVTCDQMMIKVCGVFPTIEAGTAHCQQLATMEGVDFYYVVIGCGERHVLVPNRDDHTIEDIVHHYVTSHNEEIDRFEGRVREARVQEAKSEEENMEFRQKHLRAIGVDKCNTVKQPLLTNRPIPSLDTLCGDEKRIQELLMGEDAIRAPHQECAVFSYINHPHKPHVAALAFAGATTRDNVTRLADDMYRRYDRKLEFVEVDMYKWHPWPVDPMRNTVEMDTSLANPQASDLGEHVTGAHTISASDTTLKIKSAVADFYEKKEQYNQTNE